MKKKLPIIAIGCVLFIGVSVLLYPVVSAFLAKMTQSFAIESYKKTVDSLSDKMIEQMKNEARKYNENLKETLLKDPFAEEEELDKNYIKLLGVDEIMGYIEIPKIKVYLPIYHGSSEKVLRKGAGHLKNSSLPIGGEGTHAVLTGHTGLPSAILFTNLDQLKKGDIFYIHVLNEVLSYEVDHIVVVNPEDTKELRLVDGKDYVTLVTCTPYGINTQRLLVRGTRIERKTKKMQAPTQLVLVSEVMIVPTAFLMLAILPIVILINRRRRSRWKNTKR